MDDELLLSEELIFDHLKGNFEEIMKVVVDYLYKHKIVKETYYDSLMQREKEYPTGLECMSGNIAIPHTYSEHCNRSALVIIRPDEEVMFTKMDDHSERIACKLIILMVINDAEQQLTMLRKLMTLLQSAEEYEVLVSEPSHKRVVEVLKKACQ